MKILLKCKVTKKCHNRTFISLTKMSDQFYDPRTYVKKAQPRGGGATGPKRPPPDSQARKMAQIENNTETFDVPRVDVSIANRLKTLRSQKEMSQKDLAQRANVKIDVIRDYENGKAIPDNKLIKKFEQILGGTIKEKPAKK